MNCKMLLVDATIRRADNTFHGVLVQVYALHWGHYKLSEGAPDEKGHNNASKKPGISSTTSRINVISISPRDSMSCPNNTSIRMLNSNH